MTVLGYPSPPELEHRAGPVHALAVEVFPGLPEWAADDQGAMPVFVLRSVAEACAARLRELLPDLSVAVTPVWRSVIVGAALAADGAVDVRLEEVDQRELVARRVRIVESEALGPADAVAVARETAERIARGLALRFDRMIGENET